MYPMPISKIPLTWMEMFQGYGMEILLQVVGAFLPLLFWRYSLKEIAIPVTFIGIRGLMGNGRMGTSTTGENQILDDKHHKCKLGEYWADSLCGTSY